MGTEMLKTMKEQLTNCVQSQLNDISKANAHELGEAIDMIKDLAQAIYYCTITQSMEKVEKDEKTSVSNINYYTTPASMKMYSDYERRGWDSDRMYYTDVMSDPRYGRSPMRRRMYMEGKETHNDTNSQLRELEAYLQQLSKDITEMLKDTSPQERTVLRQKMTVLANKIK